MAQPTVPPPALTPLLGPMLLCLPAAAISTQPSTTILPLLSPILRQRVQLFSASSTEPWVRLLCYDVAKAARLGEIARDGRLEPHPVSGEVEVDWDSDTEVRYRRRDQETLQALVVIPDLEIAFQLVYCTNDQEGGGDGWRVGEISLAEKQAPFAAFGGQSSIALAEQTYEELKRQAIAASHNTHLSVTGPSSSTKVEASDDGDDDDDYWARYDATPSRTPAAKQSPVPQSMQTSQTNTYRSSSAEDAYFAQYDSVQPAMDNHDPDEAKNIEMMAVAPPPLGLERDISNGGGQASEVQEPVEVNETKGAWTLAEREKSPSLPDADRMVDLAHPRPASSASSNGSQTIAKLEETAARQEQSDFGVKQHVGRSIRSLYLLARASGIDREEFERLVRTELDVLGMIENEE